MVSPDGAEDRSPPPPPAFAADDDTGSARHRYGVVLGLTILAVLFSILAPETPVGRAVAILLQGLVLLSVIVTARDTRATRGTAGALTIAAIVALAVLVGVELVPRWVGAAGTAIAVLAVLVVLTRGVARLVRERGVTVQAVAGALTTYLLIGLEFALVVRVAVGLSTQQYFAQVSNAAVTQSQEIYFSFTTLTTTGYGDLSPAVSAGRALSVLEMLVGQIYLVTVIGLLVGNLRRSSERAPNG
ncbi:MAG TPA: potassium channel family protein [Solirubrobacteraceae bacterium]|nr:potassium channel family protein [Solirubrobacteraceae bacterium]